MAPKRDGISLRYRSLSVLVEAEILRGEGFRKFQPENEILRSFSNDVVPNCITARPIRQYSIE